VDSPSWSPDGGKLAWIAGLQDGEDYATWRIALLILDFNNQTALTLHPYVPVGRGGWPPPPVWSPDGQWLTFNAWAEDPAQSGMYVIAADGSQEHFLSIPNPSSTWVAESYPPLWSPDGQTLLFSVWAEENSTFYVFTGEWLAAPIPLPGDGIPIAWSDPIP
jgi:Tol biopolymer transport system component